MRLALCIGFALVLTACTHASVSMVPMQVPGVGEVYRYSGRANFSHQLAAADRAMIDHCTKVGGGSPVVVDQQLRDLGPVAVGSSQSTTSLNGVANTVGNTTTLNGTANTSTTGSFGVIQNTNQEILFRCAR